MINPVDKLFVDVVSGETGELQRSYLLLITDLHISEKLEIPHCSINFHTWIILAPHFTLACKFCAPDPSNIFTIIFTTNRWERVLPDE